MIGHETQPQSASNGAQPHSQPPHPPHRPTAGPARRFTGGAPRGTGRTPIVRLTWLLSRPSAQSLATILLPAVAFAVTSALVLIVLGGALMFWRWDTDIAPAYQFLSVLALALLLVPLGALGGAAARLSARRRDDRLSTLRLLGATPSAVTRMTILESSAIALMGAVVGAVLYAVTMPLVGLLPFGGALIGPVAVWVGFPILAAVVLGIAVLAAVSAAIGLRAVNLTPLGVRTRQQAPKVHWLRIVLGAAVVVIGYAALSAIGGLGSIVAIITVIGLAFAAGVAVLNLIGPFAIRIVGRVALSRAKTAERLIAARGILESPKAAWRQVSGVAMTSFVAVVAGTGIALADMAGGSGMDRDSVVLIADIRTGILITLAASFVMVACSVGVNQASAILDRRELYVSLDRLGVPREAMERARSRSILLPLRTVSIGSALIGAFLVLPLAGMTLIVAPLSLLVIAGCLAAGIGLVWLALRATRPVLTAVLRAPDRL
ncbi:FtsX-like permease family protein [Plantibacter sp. YIM 135347]|uniref:FtsX-like permease family protein n=1 Tax=Plantibacter sp. YIM 135347 TaxID=3423919 RepID=UPI003D346E27